MVAALCKTSELEYGEALPFMPKYLSSWAVATWGVLEEVEDVIIALWMIFCEASV